MQQDRWPTGLDDILPPPANSYRERKKLKYEGNDYLQKTYINWEKNTNQKHFALSKTSKQIKGVRSLQTVDFVVVMETQQIHGTMCFTNNDKNKTFPLNQNLTCGSYNIL